MQNGFKWVCAAGVALLLAACGGGGGCSLSLGGLTSCSSSTSPGAPVAHVGADQSVLTGSTVTLDATTSAAANGATLTYAWVWTYKPVGSKAALSADTAAKPTFTADVNGTYSLVLTVSDGHQLSAPVVTTVVAAELNVAPVANAGINQSVMLGTKVTLDGSASSDANHDTLTYSWTLSKPDGSLALLDSSTSPRPSFTADAVGTYVGSLSVNDGKLSSAVASFVRVVVSAVNAPPVANAGTDQSVVVGSAVTLDGSGSTDANLDVITYSWSLINKPVGSTASLDSVTAVRPKFTADKVGSYVFGLTVNDGKANNLNTATVTVTASAANAAPVANAGANQNVVTGAQVTLSGAASSDANLDPLTYKWTLVSKPTASVASLSSATVVAPTFTADVAGTYVFILVVNDGKVDSAVASTTVTAAAANVAPVARGTASPQPVTAGPAAVITLDASTSTDANIGDVLTYRWVLTTLPTGSTATLTVNPTNAAQASFTADRAGTYIATLVVSDGKLDNLATVLITAN